MNGGPGWLIVAAAALLASAPAAARPPPAAADLTGYWSLSSWTQLQRPRKVKSLVLTPAEAKAWEAELAKTGGILLGGPDELGQIESEFNESGEGLARIRGQFRSSWIVSTADGRFPYTAAARKRLREAQESFDNPEDRPQSERCLASNGSSPPLLSTQDSNLVQIVQTRDHLAVVGEKNHDWRVIPIGGPRDPGQPATWSGVSNARWEGATLVVETDRFRYPEIDRDFLVHSGRARITERFTRLSPEELLYAYTVVDPDIYVTPWSAEMLLKRSAKPPFEYACHEGNYSLPTILQAARLGRQEPPKPAAPPPPATKPLGAGRPPSPPPG